VVLLGDDDVTKQLIFSDLTNGGQKAKASEATPAAFETKKVRRFCSRLRVPGEDLTRPSSHRQLWLSEALTGKPKQMVILAQAHPEARVLSPRAKVPFRQA
jgi:hypothetical protein